ncbi:MAG: hypothetical protein H7X95_09415 [Deltaproteobacteria bacterium]|nr:hypothetical protein [Deltaproteobacteria bacterium]
MREVEVQVETGRTTTVLVHPVLGRAIERESEFVAQIPSYRRAIAMDREQRWLEAAGLYQEAIVEVGRAVKFESKPLWEQAAFKIDLERRRSQVLAGADQSRAGTQSRLSVLDRGRLLRLKLVTVRAATGAISAGLVSATIAALNTAHMNATAPAVTAPAAPPPPRADAEIRMLLCATRAVAGDHAGARLELAHVSSSDRSDPARALALAVCQTALQDHENALGSLAVGVYRLGPTSRFLPGQTREVQSANDWDVLRLDPRFERIFR